MSLAIQCGLSVESSAVVSALADLIRSGLVKAVWLSSREPPREIEGMPVAADIPNVYFFQTEEGKLRNAANFWPFDDGGQPLPGLSISPDLGTREQRTC